MMLFGSLLVLSCEAPVLVGVGCVKHRAERSVASRVRRRVCVLGLVAAEMVFVSASVSALVVEGSSLPSVDGAVVEQQVGAGRVGLLLKRHGCWSSSPPVEQVGVVPGHAVVTWPGERSASYGSGRAVSAALGHVFDEERPGLVVHGFCP